ncbi:flagellar FlbD family protein [Aneurinibacillus sp. Ricciae_BoGa-3]|uniref:flagellar FlbD family protein n=1 Tax=Aneurinibacillus sp. Ricciae_BoGa-3 TaxID=3022697 RepID=UPI0023412D43|nr:flagellar FlbD family protein [Aneurinibacillus sp. Ricciae_BoGa-3]WCK52891.1 flagellar FlbD family protein [Aneurinibacillus sp. Ricciae_BoGa-3]
MIQVTRLNGTKHYINALFIEDIEATPDTVITLTNGKKLVVKESVSDVVSLVKDFYKEINAIKVATMPNAEDEEEEN